MKNYAAIILALMMTLTCASGCANNDNTDAETTAETTAIELEEIKSELFDFVSCNFTKELRATDDEMATTFYPEKEDKVYVDTVLKFAKTDRELTSEDFSGSILYNNTSYKLLYCTEDDSSIGISANALSKNGGIVHLFTILPKKAAKKDLIVTFNVADKEYKCKVEKQDSSNDPLSEKNELIAGEKYITSGGGVEFQVMEAKASWELSASDKENSKKYGGDHLFGDVVLKITNNTDTSIRSIFGYFKSGDESITLNTMMEITENTELSEAWEIAPGATEIVHVIAQLDKDAKVSDIPLRINFGGACYYCYVQEPLPQETTAEETTASPAETKPAEPTDSTAPPAETAKP